MHHRHASPTRDVIVESWHETGNRRAATCVVRAGPTARLALLIAAARTPARAFWDTAVLMHGCPDLYVALQVANIRAHRLRRGDQMADISVLAIEISPTEVRFARAGSGEAWLGTHDRWTPALPPIAPGAQTWASPPVGNAPQLQLEMCRFARRPGLRLAIASHGTDLGPLRLEHLRTWLATDTAPADVSDEGRVVIRARLGADRSCP